VWVRKDANLTSAAQMIVSSKAFDNGVVCGSENNLIIDSDVRQAFADALIDERAAILSVPEVIRLQEALFDEQGIQRRWLGKPACELAKQAGITRPYVIELLVCPVVKEDLSNPFIREKLAPIVSMISVDCDTDAIFTAQTILDIEGRGHTAIIHSQDRQAIEAYTRAVDVSRVLVNSPGTQGCIGACNGLQLSWTLGCGTGGGGSTSDNVGYEHLMNKKRLAFGHSG
jgi:acetaldehyde dehydrogenase/alcohol dehydrogenase